jgi:hypothetical protein
MIRLGRHIGEAGLALGFVLLAQLTIVLFVAFRTWSALRAGEIALGRNGELVFALETSPFWFWFAVFWHVAVIAAALAAVAVLYRKHVSSRPSR